MAINLTENAARQIQRSLAKRGKGVGLRLGVKNVGCSGLAYTFDYADEVGANDALFESHEAKVVVDKEALQVPGRLHPRFRARRAEGSPSSSKTPTQRTSAAAGRASASEAPRSLDADRQS